MTIRTVLRAALLGAALLWPMTDAWALRILLTNDDGVDAPGLVTLRERLVAAGHDVTTVAPQTDMSGKSGSMTVRGVIAVEKRGDALWAVAGTPADCAHAGIDLIMRDGKPDLVVSGTNFGQNAGPGLNISGTFGAARAAHSLGYPAIAVSQMFDLTDRARTNDYFGDAADVVVAVIDRLTEGGRPLPPGMLLNINTPLRHRAETAGWAITRPSAVSGIRFAYAWENDGTAIKVGLEQARVQFPEESDEAALAAGKVSISPLTDEFAPDVELGEWLKGRIAAKPAPMPAN
jgi:5'-nucleotidase